MARTGREVKGRFERDDKDATFELVGFDYQIIARQIVASRHASNPKRKTTARSPKVANLSDSIVSVSVHDTYLGSSTLDLQVADPEFELFEFFDINNNGKLDKIEIQYPPGSHNWWRLTQMGVSASAGSALQLTLTFMERPVVLLMHRHGPKKGSRAKFTRAEFLRSLVQDVKQHRLRFSSVELHKKQEIRGTRQVNPRSLAAGVEPLTTGGGPYGTGTLTPSSDGPTTPATQNQGDPVKRKKVNKRRGIHKGADLTVKGKKANPNQLRHGDRILTVAEELNAPEDAAIALVMTAIAESQMGDLMTNLQGSKYSGILAADPANVAPSDDEGMAEACLRGGKGFNAPEGGLIGGVKAMKKKDKSYRSLGHLCYVNQGNRANFSSDSAAENFFGEWESEAANWVGAEGYGGGFRGGSTTYRTKYNFQIGTPDHPHQSYWDGMLDLADEVRWKLFCDGRTIYFDSDMTLIAQVPAGIVYRTDPTVISFDATWDGERDLATEMTLELICEPFEFRAGEVLWLKGFGPLSRGSTARPDPLPGRWLIAETDRQSGSYTTTFTLHQPVREKLEPEAELREREREPGTGGSLRDVTDSDSPQGIINEMVLPVGRKHGAHTALGAKLTSDNVAAANAGHDRLTSSGNVSDHAGNGNDAWAVDMGVGTSGPDPRMLGLAKELARLFNIPWTPHSGIPVNKERDGLRYQLIYLAAGHYDHVHFGVKVTDTRKHPLTPETGGGPYGSGLLGP